MSDSLAALEAEAVRLHPADNVVVAPSRIAKGARIAREGVVALDSIPMGHKVATVRIAAGEIVRKYGQVIGAATADIAPGAHVHTQNLAMSELREDAELAAGRGAHRAAAQLPGLSPQRRTVGVRNYIGVLTSVNCSATVARHIAEAAERSGLLRRLPDIDGVVPITHASGCGMAGSGEGFDILRRTLWGTAANPNFGAVLLVGLGCEVVQIGRLKKRLRSQRRTRPSSAFTIQEGGGTQARHRRGPGAAEGACCPTGQARGAREVAGQRAHARPAMRRLGRLVRRHLQPGAGQCLRPAGGARRHGDPVGDAGDLRRRASADARATSPRGLGQAARAARLVGALHHAATAWR